MKELLNNENLKKEVNGSSCEKMASEWIVYGHDVRHIRRLTNQIYLSFHKP